MPKIYIDEKELDVKEGITILEAAEQGGIPIPHLCYHKAFSPEGSCRMCLVEIEGLPKLELACSTRIREGMKIFTNSEKVIEARKSVLEFLCAEHPIDCPICDKAGECKLQDYYEEYGLFDSQFSENKERKQKTIAIGKNLVLDQERCILCTRCVRFLREMSKTEELGIFYRGIHAEINTYNGVPVDNNYSGNLAEICPVGAITDKDFRFQTRTWFLKEGESICPLCSRGCNIVVESHQGFSRFTLPKRVYRIRSRENQQINGFWICDLGRYGYSYLDEKRLTEIAVTDGISVPTWPDVVGFLAERIKRMYYMNKTHRIGLILHTWLSNEELFLVERVFRSDLGLQKITFLDPPPEEGDSLLLTPERTPNKRGAQEIGFENKEVDWPSFFEDVELLLVFGSPLLHQSDLKPLSTALEGIETKVLFSARENEINSQFDAVVPLSLIAEKDGSLTNMDGIIQRFSPALPPPKNCQPEWKCLVDLAKKLAIDFSFYSAFSSPEKILEEMKKHIPFFEKNSE